MAGGGESRDGLVTYHVEAAAPPRDGCLEPVAPASRQALARAHPLRARWASPGGPGSILDWADCALAALGRPRTGPPVQVKTWNLSCVFRLPTATGPVWSKTTRAFESPESTAIGLVAEHDPGLVPRVLAARPDEGLMLLDHAPGQDCWDAGPATVDAVVGRWVGVQAALAGHPVEPRVASLPARGLAALPARIDRLLAGEVTAQLDAEELAAVRRLARALPALLATVGEAGLPDTLVHGDFHPGNWRADGPVCAVVDWSDSHLGNPAADILTLRGYLPAARWHAAVRGWVAAWRAHRPGSDPAQAVRVMTVLGPLQGALLYQRFLDHIEPDERPYHQHDPAAQLRLALAAYSALGAAAGS